MEISESTVNGIRVLALSGRLDGVAAPAVEQKIFSTLTSGPDRLVFDCAGVEYASSAGLRVFLATAKRLKTSGGRCVFAALTPGLREIFNISGFLDVLEVHNTVEEATA
ncbi:MAG: STAS domain-containing protein [Chthoniobacterales bacterium]|jgi:anti-anti-sigma factor